MAMTTVFTWVGYAAGTLTTIAFFPQVLHVWKTKRADDLHWGMLLMFTVGILLWLSYGIGIAADAGDSAQRGDPGAARARLFF